MLAKDIKKGVRVNIIGNKQLGTLTGEVDQDGDPYAIWDEGEAYFEGTEHPEYLISLEIVEDE